MSKFNDIFDFILGFTMISVLVVCAFWAIIHLGFDCLEFLRLKGAI